MLSTSDSTGRWTKMSVNFMAPSHCSCGLGRGSLAGSTELSTISGAPLISFSCPLVTTRSPSLTPFQHGNLIAPGEA